MVICWEGLGVHVYLRVSDWVDVISALADTVINVDAACVGVIVIVGVTADVAVPLPENVLCCNAVPPGETI